MFSLISAMCGKKYFVQFSPNQLQNFVPHYEYSIFVNTCNNNMLKSFLVKAQKLESVLVCKL